MKSTFRFGLVTALVFTVIIVVHIKSNQLLESTNALHSQYNQSNSNQSVEPVNVLLVGTWRSGSTWTGRFLESIPDTFYLYEPLYAIKNKTYNDHGYNIPNDQAVSLLKHLSQCSVPPFIGDVARNWKTMYKFQSFCPKSTCSLHQYMSNHCLSAKRKITKTVRLRLESARELLLDSTVNPLKIIYLVRDPRAILESMDRMEKYQWNLTPEQICSRFLKDDIIGLQKQFPENVLFVRYEDLTMHTSESFHRILRFVNGNVDNNILDMWQDMAYKTPARTKWKSSTYFLITNRSIKDWQSWRKTIKESLLIKVQQSCAEAMSMFGYLPFSDISETFDMKRSSLNDTICLLPLCLQ